MSDTSLLPQEPVMGSGLNLDASAVDKNLRSIRTVESSWRLPQLPDEVRLDLASNPQLGTNALAGFLAGIDRDLHNENDEDLPVEAPRVPLRVSNNVAEFSPFAQSAFGEAYSLINSLRGRSPAEQLDANAVQRWKLRAIDKGWLAAPEDGVVDGAWSPELNRLRQDMMYDEIDDSYRGDRVGAMPIGGDHGVLKLMQDWMSPSGLMRAAVDLDLFWDFGSIGKEWSSWGDKWRKVGDSENPLDFGKNLFDAMTGPVDDIVVPALNLALLFTGVGAGLNFAKLGMVGARGAAIMSEANLLFRVPGVARVFPALTELGAAEKAVGGLREASMLANRLSKGGAVASSIGDAMTAWRNLDAVVGTKRVVQTGMRLGFVSQVENRLLPGYQGGVSLGDIPGVGEAADKALLNPVTSTVGELLFTPYTMFEPGTFVNGGKDAVRSAFFFFGSDVGRTVAGATIGAGVGALEGDTGEVLRDAAIGGAAGLVAPRVGAQLVKYSSPGGFEIPVFSKLVRGAGKPLSMLAYEEVTAGQEGTVLFADVLRRRMSPEQWGATQRKISEQGFWKTFGEEHGIDEDGAKSAAFYMLINAGIHQSASVQAGADTSAKGWREKYWLLRNQLQAQLRKFDETTSKDEIVWTITSKENRSRRGLRKRFENVRWGPQTTGDTFEDAVTVGMAEAGNLLGQSPSPFPVAGGPLTDPWDDARIAEAIAQHSQGADQLIKQLVKNLNDPEYREAVTQYIASNVDTLGRWGDYTTETTALRSLIGKNVFDDAQLRAPRSAFGRRLKMLDYLDEFSDPVDDANVDWAQDLHDTLFVDRGVSIEEWRRKGGYYNPLARELDPWKARFTLAKSGTLSKQAYLEKADEVQDHIDLLDSWRKVAKLRGTNPGLVSSGQIGKMSVTEVTEFIKAAGITDRDQAKAVRRLNRLVRHLNSKDGELGLVVDDSFELTAQRLLGEYERSPVWADDFGQAMALRQVDDKGNAVTLSGQDALKARQAQLRKEAKFRAAEVDHDDLIAKLREAGKTAEADELEQFVRLADEKGYKVVYGQDFLAPDDTLHATGLFEDINSRHLNAMTLGNAFGRKLPEALAVKTQRYRQIALARELGRARGVDIDPESPEVKQLVADLYQFVFDPTQAINETMIDDLAHQSWLDKRGTAIRNAGMPKSLQDLGLGKHQSRVIEALTGLGYSDTDALAAWKGLKASRYADWQDQGLFAIETKLRGRSQVVDGLRFLSGTSEGHRLRNIAGKGAAIGLGATAGMVVAESRAPEGTPSSELRTEKLIGGAIGGALGLGVGAGAGALATKIDNSAAWSRYGYVADGLAAFRDKMRFTLSPFFDLSRYTEAYVLNQIAAPYRDANGARLALPFNASPSGVQKALQKVGRGHMFDVYQNEFRFASKGVFDPNDLEATGRWFSEIGILGFNPTKWMTASFTNMREAGMGTEEAYEAVQKMYHYGTQGRSAVEMSVNFIFFPFSFQKKTITHAAQWLGDDMMRSVLLHDAHAAYQHLNEKYDLETWADDHLPALEKLKQLNMFAFGVSPGRLGGINAPLVDFVVGDPLSNDPYKRGLILNLFTPQYVFAPSDPEGRSTFEQTIRRSIPALNDIQHMIEDSRDQLGVLTSPNFQTERADVREAYDQWNEFKVGVDEALKAAGATYQDMYTNPGLAPLYDQYRQKKNDLERKYPGWMGAKLRFQQRSAELGLERDHRVDTVTTNPAEATAGDAAFYEFERQLGNLKAQRARNPTMEPGLRQEMEAQGLTDPVDYPPDVLNRIRGVAVEMARTTPEFKMIYSKFYERDFGPIISEMR